MMPLYEYICPQCSCIVEESRSIKDRDDAPTCCEKMERIVSAPTMHIWDEGRRFPQLSREGDGSRSFKSKMEYEIFLKENNIGEFSTDAPVKRPHGNRLVGTWR